MQNTSSKTEWVGFVSQPDRFCSFDAMRLDETEIGPCADWTRGRLVLKWAVSGPRTWNPLGAALRAVAGPAARDRLCSPGAGSLRSALGSGYKYKASRTPAQRDGGTPELFGDSREMFDRGQPRAAGLHLHQVPRWEDDGRRSRNAAPRSARRRLGCVSGRLTI